MSCLCCWSDSFAIISSNPWVSRFWWTCAIAVYRLIRTERAFFSANWRQKDVNLESCKIKLQLRSVVNVREVLNLIIKSAISSIGIKGSQQLLVLLILNGITNDPSHEPQESGEEESKQDVCAFSVFSPVVDNMFVDKVVLALVSRSSQRLSHRV